MSKVFDPLQTGLPCDLQAERCVLANVLLDPAQLEICRDLLSPGDFSLNANQRIWSRAIEMHDAGQRVDHVTLGSALHGAGELEAIGGLSYLVDLQDGMPAFANLEGWIRIIRQKAIKRRAIAKCHETAIRLASTDEDAGEVFAETEKTLSDLTGQLSESSGFQTPAEIIRNAGGTDKYLQRRREAGLLTPWLTLNRMTGGFRPGELIILAAHTSRGKTALAIEVACYNASRGHAGAIFSLEMDAEQINDRVICSHAKLDSQELRRADAGLFDPDRRATISRAIAAAAELPIYIADRGKFTIPAMSAELRRLTARRRIEFVIVDYLQLASGVGRFDRRSDEVASITRGLKRMASEFSIPVIALSQFSRESAKDNREPQLHDLRESGTIEHDASLVLLIHFTRLHDVNAGIDTGEARLLVRKQRNGPTGWIPLTFHAPSGRFFEVDG